jgi:thioredoxin-like negative regulator of GroEL
MKQKKTKKPNPSSESLVQKFGKMPVKQKRRLFIKSVVSLGVFGVTAGAISGYDTKNKELHDLAVIGGGKPVVVQIHDTSCSICRNLKSRTLNVLEDQSSIEYRIADIQTSKGRSLQDKYGVEKTTLLLFDAEGGLVDTVYGLQTIEQLKSLFARSFPPQA